ncbi:MAG: hypothetical protein HC908_11015, partial [Calothrix sp. SM1_7_51]|nr:hypothetical protein [Calothrix sp. SM1_7_51]
MKTSKLFTYISCLLAATITFPANAQTSETTTESLPRFSSRLGAEYTTEGAGVDSLGIFEGFIPIFQAPGQNLTYLQGKLLLSTDNSALGGNLLLGHRFFSDSKNYIVGGYISYDTRNTGDAVFNQLGAGFESFSEGLDFRANFYIPIGQKRPILAETFPGSARFDGDFLAVDRVRRVQQALSGLDAEIGTKLLSLGSGSLRGYAGLYYYSGEGVSDFVGVRGRLVARPSDSLVAGLTLQSDSVFDTKLIFSFGVNFPGSSGSPQRNNESIILARMAESAERQSSIVVQDQIARDSIIATNPQSGQPLLFRQVTLGEPSGNVTAQTSTMGT